MFNEYHKFDLENREIPPEVIEAIPDLFKGNKSAMFAAAVSAESKAHHHKNVKVGCCMMVIKKNFDLSEPEFFIGANTKASPAMMAWPDRECAESRSFLNALNIPRPSASEDPNWKGMGLEAERGNLKEGGFVAAVLTVSKNENTGEQDRVNHNVLISCDQCIVNYEGLMKLGVVNKNTIIYNAKINEKGEEEDHVEQSLGELIEDFYKKKEKRDQAIAERLLTAQQEALEEYQQEISNINLQFGSPTKNPIPPIMPDDRYSAQRGYQRERVEAVWEVMENCLANIMKAVKGAAERGLSKEQIAKTLNLGELKLDLETQKFTANELKIMEQLLERKLFEIYSKE